MSVTVIRNESHFQTVLQAAEDKLVVVAFLATSWSVPCQLTAPHLKNLSSEYPGVIFLRVDIEQCKETSYLQDVKALPAFIIYKNNIVIDRTQQLPYTKCLQLVKGKLRMLIAVSDGKDKEDEAIEDTNTNKDLDDTN